MKTVIAFMYESFSRQLPTIKIIKKYFLNIIMPLMSESRILLNIDFTVNAYLEILYNFLSLHINKKKLHKNFLVRENNTIL